MMEIRSLSYRGETSTNVLTSESWNWLAMLRWVKSVPGLAPKIVPSLTRLSEHPKNMKGGSARTSISVLKGWAKWSGRTLTIVCELLEQARVRLLEGIIPLEKGIEVGTIACLSGNHCGGGTTNDLNVAGPQLRNGVGERHGRQGHQGNEGTEGNHCEE